jgi:nucleoid-associated protein EbfC
MEETVMANTTTGAIFEDVLRRLGGERPVAVTGEAGGGAVRVTLASLHEVSRVEISPEAVQDLAMLEELIVAAMNSALGSARASAQEAAFGLLQQIGQE